MANANAFAEIFSANLMVLAKATVQLTAGKENGAGSVGTADARFFPWVQSRAGDFNL